MAYFSAKGEKISRSKAYFAYKDGAPEKSQDFLGMRRRSGISAPVTFFIIKKSPQANVACGDVVHHQGHCGFAAVLLAHPTASRFGTGLRTTGRTNAPPEPLSSRPVPSQGSSP